MISNGRRFKWGLNGDAECFYLKLITRLFTPWRPGSASHWALSCQGEGDYNIFALQKSSFAFFQHFLFSSHSLPQWSPPHCSFLFGSLSSGSCSLFWWRLIFCLFSSNDCNTQRRANHKQKEMGRNVLFTLRQQWKSKIVNYKSAHNLDSKSSNNTGDSITKEHGNQNLNHCRASEQQTDGMIADVHTPGYHPSRRRGGLRVSLPRLDVLETQMGKDVLLGRSCQELFLERWQASVQELVSVMQVFQIHAHFGLLFGNPGLKIPFVESHNLSLKHNSFISKVYVSFVSVTA